MANPLFSDRNVDFLLYEVLHLEGLLALPAFSEHSRETCDLFLQSCRKLAREVLFPSYRRLDAEPPELREGAVHVHPLLREVLPRMVELGIVNASRPTSVGGQQLPMTVASFASAYLMAGNLSAYGYLGLTSGAARLLESFGSAALKEQFMDRMYSGEWTGTMALTEPQAGSSLSDVSTRATPRDGGYYAIQGSKIFISGGDHDLTENVVHLTLARIEGAPAGIKGVSLFAIPKKRWQDGALRDNDVRVAGLIHKIGWRGLPSLALNFGEDGECRGWLVGEAHRGIYYMFQMMNEARLMVGWNGIATASAAYFEACEYAAERPQGRPLSAKDPTTPQVPIIEHADVRRMLLRQKAIVEGGTALLATTARYYDLAEHAPDAAQRAEAKMLLELLTPVAKTFPAERGFEANTLAVQVHGGYGYSSEYLPEAWLRDQKLNSLHEGTSGIQSLDLLGRKVIAGGGQAMALLQREIIATIRQARELGVNEDSTGRLEGALAALLSVTTHLALLGMRGQVEEMMRHSYDYLDLFSVVVIGWQWLAQAAAAQKGLREATSSSDFYQGKLCAAQYWLTTELPR
ncbi:MAG TPA: acyl-CoA dehydrogenase, partial [Polyangiaceae bacterium]|nr:acyl-CoA dehydrogenase [Polyangiaceae bacterium]